MISMTSTYPLFRGKPEYSSKHCVGCLACEEVCPANAIEHEDILRGDKAVRKITLHLDKCQFCGNCQAHCITEKGVVLTNEYDVAVFKREESVSEIERELVLCHDCGEAVACKEHLSWVAEQIGPLAFSNPTLFLSRLKGLGIVDEDIGKALLDNLTRGDRFRITCSACRRKTTLEK